MFMLPKNISQAKTMWYHNAGIVVPILPECWYCRTRIFTFPSYYKTLKPPNVTVDFFPQTTLSQIPQFTSARFISTGQFMRVQIDLKKQKATHKHCCRRWLSLSKPYSTRLFLFYFLSTRCSNATDSTWLERIE